VKSYPVLSWRAAICKSSLPPTSRLVALTLSLHMDDTGGSCFPGAETLARETGLSSRAVRTHLGLLTGQGWLALVERGGLKGEERRANAYTAVLPTPEPCSPITTPEPCSPVNVTTLTPEPDDTPPLNDVQPNSPIELSKNSPTTARARVGELSLVSAAPTAPAGQVEVVFAAWQQATGHTRSRLDEKRKRVIRRALAAYPIEDVCAAVRGWRHSPHHRGENDRHTVYDDIELLLRDAEHIERFRDLDQRGPPMPAMTRSAYHLVEWRDHSARNGLF
jgi:Helix-turn-helix domain